MLSTQFNRDNQYQAITKPSLLAGCIALALLPSAAFAAPATEETVIVEGSATAPDDGENDYSVTSTSAGTKMQMTQRDIPQSVTIVSQQRMEDQQLQTLGEVMENTLGISKSQADSDRALYYSRGFQIDNYMVDGIPTYFESRWNLGDALSDMALFERVEVVRGATGLMTGTGNPSAAINMVRKHATSREFKGDVSAEYGSWNKERYVADLQSPLTEDGKIRARIVGGYQNNDSWLDRYNSEKTFFSGIVDADLGDLTTLSAGYEYQRIDVNSPTWGGLPRWNTDGSSNSYDRARSTAPDWAYNDKEINKVFMTLKQQFADTWQATLNATHSEVEFDSKMMYVDAYVNKADGMLVGPYSNYGPGFDYVGGVVGTTRFGLTELVECGFFVVNHGKDDARSKSGVAFGLFEDGIVCGLGVGLLVYGFPFFVDGYSLEGGVALRISFIFSIFADGRAALRQGAHAVTLGVQLCRREALRFTRSRRMLSAGIPKHLSFFYIPVLEYSSRIDLIILFVGGEFYIQHIPFVSFLNE